MLSGCGDDAAATAYDPDSDRSTYDDVRASASYDEDYPDDFRVESALPDGRKVRVWVSTNGDALLEQHYSPDADAWTGPATIYTSDEPDPCQGITLTEENGIVAVTADFGLYCEDGEPPQDSVAAVATGDLTEWETHSTEGFDGWERLTITGTRVEWSRGSRSLTWEPGDGFDD
ncbi:hypothetical protein [Nocardioides perillae]|uniref:Lipoprotein n=1 Tax=Nocardioides perillae TaxID=1119534 RepID=A0A7Y9UR38_9ACTN|nr:hypothetical protein [Nocardioides perillae]NYG53939.1 hypothetical protein [Nocardioides perillae]